MKRLLIGATFLVSFGATDAMAQTIPPPDPLHLCYTTGCGPFNGVTIGATGPAGLSNWGFSSSPPAETGTSLTIALLIPGNEVETTFPTITGQNSGVPLMFGGPFVDVATFGPTQDLSTVLGISATPPNPYSAYTAATTSLDPGFNPTSTPYVVLKVTVPNPFTTGTQGGQTPALDNTFALSGGDFIDTLLSGNPTEAGIPNGSIITGFLEGTPNGNLSTAQSSALVVSDTFSTVPGPTIGAGVPGLVVACGGMWLLNRRRRFGL